eukprot:TRINITY_DN7336_c0_g1_i4.p1 TRINITY_DN7336_c0_g1~~TRINITY_DN7336_c0_g1_i4.p1  ORF type:complete len:858 (+),score=123.95 TRINITY_DN7336_c0_g1_i4:87-2660(+)
MSSLNLRELIREVRRCKTAANEREVISRESAELRKAIKDESDSHRYRNVAKLMYIHMLGYPSHFGQIECLRLLAKPTFVEKRMGYLGLMILLDERQEVLMLVTNSLKNDLGSKNHYIAGLALCALGNIASAEMARDLAPDIQRIMKGGNGYLKRKAALCSIRVLKKVPELAEDFVASAEGLLRDRNHGVLVAGVTLVTELCQQEPQLIDQFRNEVGYLCKVLKTLTQNSPTSTVEYEIGGVQDPFLQIKVLRLLAILGKGNSEASEAMSDVLAALATNTEPSKHAGNGVLYECVNTIMAVQPYQGLRTMAVNILGKFLGNKDNNIRYVALNTLAKVVTVDAAAVQRHRTTIVECVQDADVSIRRRALELVYALVNESNIRTLTQELLSYLAVCDTEFKPDLTNKICLLIQKFSPDRRWHVDNLLEVMACGGSYVKMEVAHSLAVLIQNSTDVSFIAYAARKCYQTLKKELSKAGNALLSLCVWCIGEFGDRLVDQSAPLLEGEQPMEGGHVSPDQVLDLLNQVLEQQWEGEIVQGYVLTALMKLSSRFPQSKNRIKSMIQEYQTNIDLEIQTRSCEYGQMFSLGDSVIASLMERMPALNESKYTQNLSNPNVAENVAKIETQNGGNLLDILDSQPVAQTGGDALGDLLGGAIDGGVQQPAVGGQKDAGDDLMDLLGGGLEASPPQQQPVAGGMDDLLGGLSVPTQQPSPSQQQASADPMDLLGGLDVLSPQTIPQQQQQQQYPPIMAYDKNGVRIMFNITNVVNTVDVTAVSTNSNMSDVGAFSLQAAVPKGMEVRLEPASGSSIPAGGMGSATQVMHINNPLRGQKAIAVKLKIEYMLNGGKVEDQCIVNQFPMGL